MYLRLDLRAFCVRYIRKELDHMLHFILHSTQFQRANVCAICEFYEVLKSERTICLCLTINVLLSIEWYTKKTISV